MVHSRATLARYTILVASHRLVNRGLTDGLDLDLLPEAVLGQPEARMREAPHAKLGGIFMRGPLAMAYAMRHPEAGGLPGRNCSAPGKRGEDFPPDR